MSDERRRAVDAAMSVGEDIAHGRLFPARLEAAAAAECRRLFVGPSFPGDALWELHGEVCRQHLAAGGVSADELAEWLAVTRQRESEEKLFTGATE